MRLTASLLIIALGLSSCFHKPEKPKSLALDKNWSLNSEVLKSKFNISLPSGIHSVLFANGLINDPYRDQNLDSLDWIWGNDWVYETEFQISTDFFRHDRIDLTLGQIDTYAQVFVNDSPAGSCSNFFVEQQLPIRHLLKEGKNRIKLVFQDPEKKIEKDMALGHFTKAEQSFQRLEKDLRPFVRKPAYQFGWDFSPKLMTAGIYSLPVINAWSSAIIKGIDLVRMEDVSFCRLTTIAEDAGSYSVQIRINNSVTASESIDLKKGENSHLIKLEDNGIKPWNPIGIGEQELSLMNVKLMKDLRGLDEKEKTVGYSNASLVREKDSIGESFFFRINGEPVFAKGGNLVPLDIQLDRVKPEDYLSLIEKIKKANFNMIRVWGGGHYPADEFYDLCDQNGIMVWQDLMFANTLYPWDSAFLIAVEDEVRHQVTRLKDHPCIVLWCGNNEIELAWRNWGWQETLGIGAADSVLIWKNQKYLFDSLIPGILRELDPNRSYLSSSPISNFSDDSDFRSGNVHDWAVWHGDKPIEAWTDRSPRFNSEFGMQSIPSLALLNNYTEDTLLIGDEFMSFRQQANLGWERLNRYLSEQYRRPRTIEHQVYLSQIHQAMAIGKAAEFMRLEQPRTMGVLVWQINDTWPGISWSILDHRQVEKPAYYSLKKAFEPIVIFSDQKNRRLKTKVLNESGTSFRGHAMVFRKNFFGTTLSRDSIPLRLDEGQSSILFERYIGSILDTGQGRWTFFQTQVFNGADLVQEDIHFLEKPRSLWLKKTELKYDITKSEEGFLIELSSDFLAKDVWLEAINQEGYFENNLLDLVPGQKTIVKFIPSGERSQGALELRVVCLNDYR